MTSTEPTLADRMYAAADKPVQPEQASPAAAVSKAQTTPQNDSGASLADRMMGAAEVAVRRPPEPAGPPEPKPLTVDELLAVEQSDAERMQESAALRPESPDGYQRPLAAGFDKLEQDARVEQNAEEIAALAEGRKATAEYMHELGVSTEIAKELTRNLGKWNGRYMRDELPDDDRLDQMRSEAMATLKDEWGKEMDSRIRIAQRAAGEACRRLPWLQNLIDAGAGNEISLIRHFAAIGLRQARKGRGAK